jgi:hypothetical protein
MPKPIFGDNGSGMHVHQSIWKGGKPVMAGNKYADLSQECLWYIGGIIKHAKALNAFTNPSTNSYKRLVPGYEAPVLLAYSARNRSASCRIPYTSNPKAKRVEVRFPDPMANPYLAFAAMLMAGLDGIQNKIDPGPAMDKDLYDLPPKELKKIPTVCGSLREALASLDKDRGFLKAGGVFSDDFIDSYISLKMEDVMRFEMTPHPVEFDDMYYGRPSGRPFFLRGFVWREDRRSEDAPPFSSARSDHDEQRRQRQCRDRRRADRHRAAPAPGGALAGDGVAIPVLAALEQAGGSKSCGGRRVETWDHDANPYQGTNRTDSGSRQSVKERINAARLSRRMARRADALLASASLTGQVAAFRASMSR